MALIYAPKSVKSSDKGRTAEWLMWFVKSVILYRHTVAPLNPSLIPAAWGPPALPVHMKTGDVFLQSGTAMDLFWHVTFPLDSSQGPQEPNRQILNV